jgi:branched-chain amino acid transport system permease protein
MLIFSAILSGLAVGSMYGLLALGYHVTWAVSNTVNFALGSSMMLGAVLTYSFAITAGWPMAFAVPTALLGCAIYGLLIERFVVRPFVARNSDAWLMATVAAGIVLDTVVLFTFGKEPRALPSPLAATPFQIFGAGIFPLQIVIPLVGLAIAATLHTVSRRTRWGKAMLAVVQNRRAAALMGIDVTATIAAAYALATVFAGTAGILVAPLFNVSSTMGFLFGIKAFAVAILGGIDNAWGVVIAGILFGITEALITAVLGSSYTYILSFGLVIVALALMPHGLLGRARVRKV